MAKAKAETKAPATMLVQLLNPITQGSITVPAHVEKNGKPTPTVLIVPTSLGEQLIAKGSAEATKAKSANWPEAKAEAADQATATETAEK